MSTNTTTAVSASSAVRTGVAGFVPPGIDRRNGAGDRAERPWAKGISIESMFRTVHDDHVAPYRPFDVNGVRQRPTPRGAAPLRWRSPRWLVYAPLHCVRRSRP